MENGKGYSASINEAGIYEKNDTWARVSHVGPEKGIVIIRIPLVYEYALTLNKYLSQNK